ncbi:MAG: di-trans,poly-cis-decaprenylcistransferase [Elusimicrobia bacterium RIFCSPHIGHO2_02_FULL_57_9]|nr:MAG: di-trans,poly-cis-decaprenylcistransferase [Elusimicrobia bacterium RIFCSPHIGHO2_02_FULL_57_9]
MQSAPLPRHIAIIMDGNGRWAAARGLPRALGHKAGVDSVREAVSGCAEMGIEVLTLYSFSTENWLRPKEEVNELMNLLSYALKRETLKLDEQNIRLKAIGRRNGLPAAVRRELEISIERLSKNTGLCLNLALNYGSRQEITDAVNQLLASGAKNITQEDIARNLYTAGLPDPDLVIRTSGEMRVSNFLLWQIAYAELYITPVFWPDFRREHLLKAIEEFQRRERRFGGVEAKT